MYIQNLISAFNCHFHIKKSLFAAKTHSKNV